LPIYSLPPLPPLPSLVSTRPKADPENRPGRHIVWRIQTFG